MDVIQEKMEKVLCDKLDGLNNLEAGSKECTNEVDDIVAIHKQLIEARKIEQGSEEAEKSREEQRVARAEDQAYKEQQLKEQRIDRWIKIGMFSAELVVTVGFIVGGFKFEETGTYGSGTFKWVRDKFKFGKK